MVIGYHVILGAYGFWLPNDPRGSWSRYVWAKNLRQIGPATKVTTRKSVAGKPHDRSRRIAAKAALKYPAVRFTGLQARCIGDGFADLTSKLGLTVYVCSIMPDHAHLVLGRRHRDTEEIAEMLKRAGTRKLNEAGIHPMNSHRTASGRLPSPWAKHGWIVFIDTPRQMHNAIRYVQTNPIHTGLPRQRWTFVTPSVDER
jgi:REP element-mobilizing transposase RayT